jgi:hypothetical protein
VWAAIARAVGVGQRDLVITGPLQLFQHVLASRASRADRGDLFGQVLDPRAGWCGFGGVALVEPLQVIVELGIGEFDELRQRGAGEVAVLVVDRFDPGAIDREQFPAKQVQLTAEQHELAEDRAEGVAVVAAEIGDGLKVGPEVAQQPDHLDVAMALGFEPAARPDAVEVAVDVEFQQIVGCVASAPGWLGRDTDETSRRQIQSLNEGVDEADRVVLANVFVQRFRQQQRLGSVGTGDVRHDPDSDTSCVDSESVTGQISHGLLVFGIFDGPARAKRC